MILGVLEMGYRFRPHTPTKLQGVPPPLKPLGEAEENTHEVGFLWTVYNSFSEFWPETEISLKISEPTNQPLIINRPVETNNYFQFA